MVVHQSLSLLQDSFHLLTKISKGTPLFKSSIRLRIVFLRDISKIVQCWIKKVAWQRMLSENVIRDAAAAVLPYGSYGLGVHNSESDIDALCVVPWFATMAEDFFIVLYNMLKGRPEVSDIHCVKDAKVPLMRFEFEGIPIDFPYAQLQVISVPKTVDLLNPFFMNKIDETSWRSVSGVIVNVRVLQLVPNLENFRSLLRCTKFWAKQRGIYGNLFGFFGGIHLAILSAVICQRSPDACLSALVTSFFSTFASWPWPTPVVLQDGSMQSVEDVTENRCLMPIKLPCCPYQYCQSYITRSTFNRIRVEFLRGQKMTNDILKPDYNWDRLFEPYCNMYLSRYPRFLKICLVACVKDSLGDWIGWVKSRFPSLILKLEEIRVSCDPNPTEYANTSTVDKEPAIFFYWGLNMGRGVDLTSVLKEFKNNLTDGYQGIPGKIVLSIVPASELSNVDQVPTRARRRVVDYDPHRIPVYSRHLPNYVVGFMASQGDRSSCV